MKLMTELANRIDKYFDTRSLKDGAWTRAELLLIEALRVLRRYGSDCDSVQKDPRVRRERY